MALVYYIQFIVSMMFLYIISLYALNSINMPNINVNEKGKHYRTLYCILRPFLVGYCGGCFPVVATTAIGRLSVPNLLLNLNESILSTTQLTECFSYARNFF
jgi:hypothetical protein